MSTLRYAYLELEGLAYTDAKSRIALLGVPIEIGASQAGTLMGPAALRTAGIGRMLEQLGFDVEDHGDIAILADLADEGPAPANAKYYDEVKSWIRALSERALAGAFRRASRSSWAAITRCRWDR